MFKFKSKLIVAVMVILGITILACCTKEEIINDEKDLKIHELAPVENLQYLFKTVNSLQMIIIF